MQDLSGFVKPVVESMGYVCWGMEFLMFGSRARLRVLIDHPDGVTLDDCSAVSHQLSGVLDVDDPISRPYTLEVSSPGIERPLMEPAHYRRYLGEKVKVRNSVAVNGRKNFVGRLGAVGDDAVTIEMEDDAVELAFNTIRSARLVCDDF